MDAMTVLDLSSADGVGFRRLRRKVYNAARKGDFRSLQTLLKKCPNEEVKNVVEATTNGMTPLIRACLNGHLKVVKYLVQVGMADVEQTGTILFNRELFDDIQVYVMDLTVRNVLLTVDLATFCVFIKTLQYRKP